MSLNCLDKCAGGITFPNGASGAASLENSVVSAAKEVLWGERGGMWHFVLLFLPQNQGSLYCVHADVSKGDFCGCFWSNAFQNTLLERNQELIDFRGNA